jgi:hypothetical protein
LKKTFSDYTETQFIQFMREVFSANDGAPDEVLDPLLDEFERLTEHPSGAELIYYPEDEDHCTPEGITKTIKQWREANGLPGFKSGV